VEDDGLARKLKESCEPFDYYATLESLEKVIGGRKESFDSLYDFKAPAYSYIKLSQICDNVVEKFINDFIKDVETAHWSTVKAFNSRMHYNFSNREWWFLKPESHLKSELKKMLLGYFMNPKNYSEDDKNRFVERFQNVQEDISKTLTDIVQDEVFESNKDKWKDALFLSGGGSGNKRKSDVGKIIKEKYTFDRQKNEENILFVDLVKSLEQIESLKEGKAKFELI